MTETRNPAIPGSKQKGLVVAAEPRVDPNGVAARALVGDLYQLLPSSPRYETPQLPIQGAETFNISPIGLAERS